MALTFPTKLADDYVPATYLRPIAHSPGSPAGETPFTAPLRYIAFRFGHQLLALTPLTATPTP